MNTARQHEPAGLDWELIWRQSCRRRKGDRNDREFWNKRASSFADHARESSYVTDFLRITALPPQWSCPGCRLRRRNPGNSFGRPRYARLPPWISRRTMLAILSERCREKGETNVKTHLLSWEDDWQAADIERHDVAIASRSLVVEDLSGAISKLAVRGPPSGDHLQPGRRRPL